MFAVIYRQYVKPDKEQHYQQLWHQLASYFVEHRGALGSCLHKADDGLWVAYSRWPDRATRDASWLSGDEISTELPDNIRQVIAQMKDCVYPDKKLPEIAMDVVDDLLT